MQNNIPNITNIDKYTQDVKSKLDKNYLSPLFIRYANLLFMNELYEECITVCKTGLQIYPNYLTAKLILLKAFLKAEYLNEAEILFKEIKNKIPNKELLAKLEVNINAVRNMPRQEKIYYSKAVKNKYDFKIFDKSFQLQGNLFSDFSMTNAFDKETEEKIFNDKEFDNFISLFRQFHFEKSITSLNISSSKSGKNPDTSESSDLLNKIKIVTETLADIYAEQGNYKEAFEAYKILLRAGSKNKNRIEEKLYELERNMLRDNRM